MEVNKKILNNSLVNKNFLTKGGEPKKLVRNELAYPMEAHSTNPNRLNGLDSTLMEDSAYRNIENEAFKIEYRIDKLEGQLRTIMVEIEAAKSLGDKLKLDTLNLKKHSIENELQALYAKYKGTGVTNQISFGLTSLMHPKKSFFTTVKQAVGGFVSKHVLSKISKRFNTGQDLKIALNKLETINKSVDELVSSQAPYGEAEDKYDMLSKYLTKANSIQYQVSMDLSSKKSKVVKNQNPFAELTSKNASDAKEQFLSTKNKAKDMAAKNALNLNNNLKG